MGTGDTFDNMADREEQLHTMQGYLAADIVHKDCWKEEVAYATENGLSSDRYTKCKAVLEKEFKKRNNMMYFVHEGEKVYMSGMDSDGRFEFTNRMVSYPRGPDNMLVPIGDERHVVRSDPMPNTYRSNKSVITKAIKMGVELVDEKGKPLGKTAIQKACRTINAVEKILSPTGSVTYVTPLTGCIQAAEALNVVINKLGDVERLVALSHVKRLFDIK